MKKRIPPNFKYMATVTPNIPLQTRVARLMACIHAGTRLWPYADDVTVKECIRRGLIKRGRDVRSARWAHNMLIPLVPAPMKEVVVAPRPYAKRNADLDAAGLRRRGKANPVGRLSK